LVDQRRGDTRLVPAAAGAWAGAAVGARLTAPVAAVVAASVVVAALVARRRAGQVAFTMVASAVCVAAGLVIAAVRAPAATAGPLARLAAAEPDVVVDAVIAGDPVVKPSRPGTLAFRSVVLVPVQARRVAVDGRTFVGRIPMLVVTTARGWAHLLPSQHVTVGGRLSAPQFGDPVAAQLLARGPPESVTQPSTVQAVAGRLREGLRDASRPLAADERGLFPGLVDGDTTELTDNVRANFRTTGLSHLVAVSGANVAVIGVAALAFARLLGLGLRFRAGVALAAITGFVVLARPSPSVLRAAVMGGLGLLAMATGRGRSGLAALAAAVLSLVYVEPSLATTDGFVLSVLATAGLLLVAPRVRDVLAARVGEAVPRWVVETVALATAAQLTTAPYIALRFGRLSLVAIPANLLAAPAVPFATVLGVIAAAVAPASLFVARLVARVAAVPVAWLVAVARVGAGVPFASVGWPGGAVGAIAGLVVAGGVLALRRWTGLRRPTAVAGIGVLGGQLALGFVPHAWPPPQWQFVVCDVGQGDGLVLRAGPTSAVVVDVGPDPALMARCLNGLGVRRIPLIVLSHFHADHVEGLPGVLGRWPVDAIEIGPLDEPPTEVARVRLWAAAAGVPLVRAVDGATQHVGAVQWTVLGPAAAYHGTDSDPNNSSLVMLVSLRGFTVLLTGDVEQTAQEDMLGSGIAPRADVLKIPHHGSANQSSQFIAGVGARIAIASVGLGNVYGHPSAATLATLQHAGARTFRTDLDGAVAVYRAGRHVVAEAAGKHVTQPPHAHALAVGPAATDRRATMEPCLPPSRRSLSSSATRACSSSAPSPTSSWPRGPPSRLTRASTSRRSTPGRSPRSTSRSCSPRRCSATGGSSSSAMCRTSRRPRWTGCSPRSATSRQR
jgi:competence protein ComEC